MKRPTYTFFLKVVLLLFIFNIGKVSAQGTEMAEIKIKTSAICNECKNTIESALAFTKGVKKSFLDVPTSIVTVSYNPLKTTPEKIRIAISNAGYDADDVPANPKAYKKLSNCCKKESGAH
ncbi:MAG: heavy metal-associated domain-containing protein [Bacteroidia bacterium]